MSKYHDDLTFASDPGRIEMSDRKLRKLCPELYGLVPRIVSFFAERRLDAVTEWRDVIREHLRLGDSQAAVVIRKRPLLVAAYTDELDCVALLRFEAKLANTFQLKEESRLLTVNTYSLRGEGAASDLTPGAEATARYGNFMPMIADFLTDDPNRVSARMAQIDDQEWTKCWDMGNTWLQRYGNKARDGSPLCCGEPAF